MICIETWSVLCSNFTILSIKGMCYYAKAKKSSFKKNPIIRYPLATAIQA